MNHAAKIVSLVGLTMTIVPCLMFLAGYIDHNLVKWIALLGTIVWFAATPLWMGRTLPVDASEVEI